MRTFKPIKPTLGAIVTGIDLNTPTQADVRAIHEGLLTHQVLFFRNQHLDSKAQVELARTFGNLHLHPVFPTAPDFPEIIVLDSHALDLKDNELWHTDVTFSKTPPMGCILRAVKTPKVGGDTLWASLSAAFEGLDAHTQAFLKGKTATHDIRLSFPKERFGQSEEDARELAQIIAKNPPISHPVVRTHPVTGKQGLFVTEGFTSHIDGLLADESRALLDRLFAHATRKEYSVRWRWQEGDVVIWDNRITQHKASFDYGDAHRIMHRATVNGDVPFYREDAQSA